VSGLKLDGDKKKVLGSNEILVPLLIVHIKSVCLM